MDHKESICQSKSLTPGSGPVVMGILNVTPDSFSDGGEYFDIAKAIDHALAMVSQGAGIIDIGGESTRPGSKSISADEQIGRIVPVIEALASRVDVPISIDTTLSEVARAAIEAGGAIINDISALQGDERMAGVAAQLGVPVVLMHMQGTPDTMQKQPVYQDVVAEVKGFLRSRIDFAVDAGIGRGRIVVDPGIGFGKTVAHNLELLRRVDEFHELGVPVLVGTSRKSFIGKVLGVDGAHERLLGTAATVAWCVWQNVEVIRVHDVREMVQVAQMIKAIQGKDKSLWKS
ncbi:MAG: dihydropteroate synthase [Phycisphaerae bacterium]|nr:dihydropteroate synthase [Phycisphaerae bacterium]